MTALSLSDAVLVVWDVWVDVVILNKVVNQLISHHSLEGFNQVRSNGDTPIVCCFCLIINSTQLM